MLRGEVKKIAQERREAVKDYLKIMESFLIKSEWFAGDEVTIADFSCLANVATIKVNKIIVHKTRETKRERESLMESTKNVFVSSLLEV